jgi:uncharacterized protein YndB with AHSA1/START domain
MTSAVDIRDDGPMIVATVSLPGCAPNRALAAFTDPELVANWWRGTLTTNLQPGGPYTVDFPAINAKLTGQVVSFGLAHLEFTWSWDNEAPDSTVTITTEPGSEPGSALITVKHGPHQDDDTGRVAHQEHWEGWEFFLPRLVAALRAQDGGMPT